jgi:hypothetical protein
MKLTRTWLLRITGALGVLIIVYSLIRQLTGFSVGENIEKQVMDGIVFIALALFLYNRKLRGDEQKARAAAEAAKQAALEEAEDPPESGG